MLGYDHERTETIVARLVRAAESVRSVTVAGFMVLFGAALSLVGGLVSGDFWWLFGVIGIVVGYALGTNLAVFLVALIEWMAQALIAEGEMVEALRKGRE